MTDAQKTRDPAQVKIENLEQKFMNLFVGYKQEIQKNPEVVKPFARVSLQILKRSYFYLDKFDAELERIHKDCMAKREGVRVGAENVICESPMDLPDYRKLQASRIVLERQKTRLAYYYTRLLDMANAQDEGLRTVLEESVVQFKDLTAGEIADNARLARSILNQWNSELRDLVKVSANSEGPISYELAVDLFKLKEETERDWAEQAGKTFKVSAFVGTFDDVASGFEKRADELRAEKKEGESLRDYSEVFEVFESLKEKLSRRPQSVAWRNHTGRSFKRGQMPLSFGWLKMPNLVRMRR